MFQRSCFGIRHWHQNSTESGLRPQLLPPAPTLSLAPSKKTILRNPRCARKKSVLAASRSSDAVQTAPFVSLKTSGLSTGLFPLRRWHPPQSCLQMTMTMTMTMTHSEKSHIRRMKAWPYRQECRGHDPTKKNLFLLMKLAHWLGVQVQTVKDRVQCIES